MKLKLGTFWGLLKEAAIDWNKDNALRLGAALSYYTVFSLGPLLILVTGLVGLIFGEEAARGELSGQLSGLMGSEGAQAIETMVASAGKPSSGILASISGFLILIFGATGVFAELKAALNQIWDAEPPEASGILMFLRDRFLSFAMVLSIGFLLLVSLVITAVLAAVSAHFSGILPVPEFFYQALTFAVSFGLITVLFALIFKLLPDKAIEWRDVWFGAAFTSLLFTLGKSIIGLYLGKSGIASAYGASASVVVVMLWTYYSSLILFYGAELTQVYAQRHGSYQGEKPIEKPRKDPARAKVETAPHAG